jgi:hypothetical protein
MISVGVSWNLIFTFCQELGYVSYTAMGYMLEQLRFDSWQGYDFSLLLHSIQTSSGRWSRLAQDETETKTKHSKEIENWLNQTSTHYTALLEQHKKRSWKHAKTSSNLHNWH